MPSAKVVKDAAAKKTPAQLRAEWLAALKVGDEVRLDMRNCPEDGSGAWLAKVEAMGRAKGIGGILKLAWEDDVGVTCGVEISVRTGRRSYREVARTFEISPLTPSGRAELRELVLVLRSHGDLFEMLGDAEFMGSLSLETLRTMIAVLRPRFDKYQEAKGETE